MSADPAMESYIPEASSNEGADERNQNLPGMGGLYNSRNLQTYHYAGNNPLKYTDPSGRFIAPFIIAPKSSLPFERTESTDHLSTFLGLVGIGTSLSNPYTAALAIGSFLYSEWDGDKKDRAIEALSERVNNLEVTAKFLEERGEVFRAGLFEAAATLYEDASSFIKEAAKLQEDIDNADAETDITDLENRRDEMKQRAETAFQKAVDTEYLARHGRKRPETEENNE